MWLIKTRLISLSVFLHVLFGIKDDGTTNASKQRFGERLEGTNFHGTTSLIKKINCGFNQSYPFISLLCCSPPLLLEGLIALRENEINGDLCLAGEAKLNFQRFMSSCMRHKLA